MNARSEPPAPSIAAPRLPAREPIDPVALGLFLTRLAHDLRSPLGVVTEAIGELRSDFAPEMTHEHTLLVNLAGRGLLRLGHIADTVALVAALESGHLDLGREPVDLVGLVRAATATAAAIEPRRDVELACELPPGVCIAVGDPRRLPYAICEILINAVRHAKRRAHVKLEIAGDVARVAIEDDGQGVSEEARATVFHRFVVHRSRSGLGIGLSAANDVIALHGGSLTLEASTLPPGRPGTVGARFVISLPLSGVA